MRLSTRNQQVALRAIELLNRSSAPKDDEVSLRIKEWFQAIGITINQTETLLMEWGGRYSLDQEQLRRIAELEHLPPSESWFTGSFDSALQHAAPGLVVAFVCDNGRYVLSSVVETRASKNATPLLGIDGLGKGWYDLDGQRRTKEGQLYQGSAYAGQIVPVNDEVLSLIERQELLGEITGHHQAPFRVGGTLHAASTQTLHMVRDLLRNQALLSETHTPAHAQDNSAQQ